MADQLSKEALHGLQLSTFHRAFNFLAHVHRQSWRPQEVLSFCVFQWYGHDAKGLALTAALVAIAVSR